MDVDREAIIKSFIAESEESLGQAEQLLLALEREPDDVEAVQSVFRTVHSLKGNAWALGYEELTQVAHAVEDVLDRLRRGTLQVGPEVITPLLQAVDLLGRMVHDAVQGTATPVNAKEPVLRQMIRVLAGKRSPTVVPAATTQPPAAQAAAAPRRDDRSHTLRITIEQLDRLLNVTGEIAIARGRMTDLLSHAHASMEETLEAHRESDRVHLELQDLVMKMRLVPVGPMLRRCSRAVRDLAEAGKKQVELSIVGEDVLVDTAVVEHLADPVMHMVRNSVDHGIEMPDVRVQKGKPAKGKVTLRAMQEGGSIIVQVEDDGAGFSRAKIMARAKERGLLEDADRLVDEEIWRVVMEPGFSTAETVTEVSGRGVGMDVVRREVEGLRGSISIESDEGQGTTISARLPLTVAIIEGFHVGVGGDVFVLPVESVVECVELPAEGRAFKGRTVINRRGVPLPVIRLRDLFEVDGEPPPRENVVVIKDRAMLAGLTVDDLHGEGHTVLKPLGRVFKAVAGVSGATILGDGRVALILDVPALMRQAVGRKALQDAAAGT